MKKLVWLTGDLRACYLKILTATISDVTLKIKRWVTDVVFGGGGTNNLLPTDWTVWVKKPS